MNGRTIKVRALCSRDEEAWRGLIERAAEPNPLFEPDCLIPAARHQEYGDEIDIVVAEEGGRFFASIPVRRVARWSGIPYPWVVTKVRRMTYCGTPLVDPERGGEAMAAILGALANRRGVRAGRLLVLQEVAQGGPAERAVRDAAEAKGTRAYRYETWERPHLRRRSDATYNAGHTKKDLANLARLRRKLDAAVGAKVEMVDRSADPVAVEEIIRLEAAGYKAATGVAMSTVAGEPEYFRGMCDRFRQQGRLRVYTLEANEIVCAIVMFLREADGLFMIKVGYDERFARSSPGLQLHLDLIQHFHDDLDLDWIDVCTYKDNQTLLRMYPDRKRFVSLIVPIGNSAFDRLAARTFVAARPWLRRLVDLKRGGLHLARG